MRLQTLLRRDTTPVRLLLLAALVGTLTGLVGVAFNRAVNLMLQLRIDTLTAQHSGFVTGAISAFAASAIMGGGSGMVLGREGPTVQLGGNIGGMCSDLFRLRSAESRHTLLATGAAAGLAAAFNAPLAGILFIIEEMRPQFRYSLVSIKAVFVGVIMASIVYRLCEGNSAIIDIGQLRDAPTDTLWLYLLLGVVFGAVGVAFNRLIFTMQDRFQRLHRGRTTAWVLWGSVLAGLCGVLSMLLPQAAGVCRVGPRAADGDCAGAGDDQQLSADPADDHYLSGRYAGGTVFWRQAALFITAGAHAGENPAERTAVARCQLTRLWQR